MILHTRIAHNNALAYERLIEGIPIEIKTSKSKTIAKGNSGKRNKTYLA